MPSYRRLSVVLGFAMLGACSSFSESSEPTPDAGVDSGPVGERDAMALDAPAVDARPLDAGADSDVSFCDGFIGKTDTLCADFDTVNDFGDFQKSTSGNTALDDFTAPMPDNPTMSLFAHAAATDMQAVITHAGYMPGKEKFYLEADVKLENLDASGVLAEIAFSSGATSTAVVTLSYVKPNLITTVTGVLGGSPSSQIAFPPGWVHLTLAFDIARGYSPATVDTSVRPSGGAVTGDTVSFSSYADQCDIALGARPDPTSMGPLGVHLDNVLAHPN